MVVATAAAVLSSVQTVYDLAKAANGLKTNTEIRLAISKMLDELIILKQAAVASLDEEATCKQRVRELQEEIRTLKERGGELEKYERKRFFPGSFVYVPRANLRTGEQPHYACARCYEERQQIISLQPTDQLGSRRTRLHRCPSCCSEFAIGREMTPEEVDEAPGPGRTATRKPRGPQGWMA